MTEKFSQIIEKEKIDCQKMRLRQIKSEKDYSTLVSDITERAKAEAKAQADEQLKVGKQSLDMEKAEIRRNCEELQYKSDKADKLIDELRADNFFFRWKIKCRLAKLKIIDTETREYRKLH